MEILKSLKGMADEAWRILDDSYAIVKVNPALLVPLLPLMVVAWVVMKYVIFPPGGEHDYGTYLLLFFLLNFCLFVALAVSTVMMRSLHQGERPDLAGAYVTVMSRYALRILSLTGLWYLTFFFIVFLITLLMSMLRILRGMRGVLGFVVGLLLDALNMVSFIAIPVIVFEEASLGQALRRVHDMAVDKARPALAGLVLTRVMSMALGLVIGGVLMVHADPAQKFMVVLMVVISWLWGLYLDYLFATGLYLKTAWPDSPLLVNFRKDADGQAGGDGTESADGTPGEGGAEEER